MERGKALFRWLFGIQRLALARVLITFCKITGIWKKKKKFIRKHFVTFQELEQVVTLNVEIFRPTGTEHIL